VNNDPVLRQVVQTRQPVMLYQAPKNRWYYLKVYGTAGLWLGTGAYAIKFQDDIKDLKDLAFFVRPTYVFVGFSFLIIGCYICTAPTNRIRVLEVIPSIQGGPLQLRISAKAAPWTREKIIYSNLGGATISEKTFPMVEELIEAERARRQNVFEGLEHMSIITRSWEYSARWVQQKWTSFFLKFKFAVLRFGIAKVEVQGEKWKIDCSGWLLEDGKGMLRPRFCECPLTERQPSIAYFQRINILTHPAVTSVICLSYGAKCISADTSVSCRYVCETLYITLEAKHGIGSSM
jgi:hypothetical protein